MGTHTNLSYGFIHTQWRGPFVAFGRLFQGLQIGTGPGRQSDMGAVPGQLERDGAPDPTTGAGDQRDLFLKSSFLHPPLLHATRPHPAQPRGRR